MSKTWKAAESRIGAWLGAKGIGKSGRLPLSGGNSGISRADSPHPTIFVESKRDRSYHTVIKQWLEHEAVCSECAIPVIELEDGIICFHSEDAQQLVEGAVSCYQFYRPKKPPRALTLFHNTIEIKENSLLDKNKLVVCVCLVYHHHRGFWILLKRESLKLWWDCVLAARIEREQQLKAEGLL